MIDHHTVSNPVVPALIIESIEQPGPSRLGDILASLPRKLRTFPEWFTDACDLFVPKPAWTTPTFEVASRLIIKAKRKRYWCADCKDYRTKDHDCATPLPEELRVTSDAERWEARVKCTRAAWQGLHELRIDPPARNPRWETNSQPHCLPAELRIVKVDVLPVRPFDSYSFTDHRSVGIRKNQRLTLKAAVDYLPTPKCKHADILSFTFCTEETITRCPDCDQTKGHVVLSEQMFAPPMPFSHDAQYLKWAERTCSLTPMEVMEGARCLGELNRLNMPVVLPDGPINHQGTSAQLGLISDARQKAELLGGVRVNTTGSANESDWSKGDRNSADYRADAVVNTQRLDRRVGHLQLICKRDVCCVPFAAVRKGQMYCSKNCCNRHSEETNTKGEN